MQTAANDIDNKTFQRINESEYSDRFLLEHFFPYLVRYFHTQVSSVAETYTRRYDMSLSEWRTIAILGSEHELTAAQIVDRSTMDKVAVSRAVAKMKTRGWLIVTTNQADGRSKVLRLSDEGRSIYGELVPRMRHMERDLLAGVSSQEIDQFKALMKKIGKNCANHADCR